MTNGFSQNTESTIFSTKYYTENLKGDTVQTWKHWNLAKNQPLYLNIINADKFPQEKIDVIKQVIFSDDKIELNGLVYYKGWLGALNEASIQSTLYNIPTKIELVESDTKAGDIIILLTNWKDEDGFTGFTKSTVEDNVILKSYITIYDVENISSEDLGIITRHEMGHALGMGHSTDPADLMHPKIKTNNPYVSQCNIDAIVSLYDGKSTSQVVCNV